MTIIDGQQSIFDLLDSSPSVDVTHLMTQMPAAGTFTNPGDLEAMFDVREAHYQEFNVMKGNWKPYRGWEISTSSGKGSDHLAGCYSANLQCRHAQIECYCVSTIVYRVYCHGCETWTEIYATENLAWEAHLDSCWPGWRDLPVLESKTVGYSYKYTYPESYPTAFKKPGAPILDCRGITKYATRHVPGSEPFGGIKVGVIRDCKKHNQEGDK